jgi:hypothetical protein
MFLICPADPPRILDMSAKDSRPIDRREDISPPVLPLGSMIITMVACSAHTAPNARCSLVTFSTNLSLVTVERSVGQAWIVLWIIY